MLYILVCHSNSFVSALLICSLKIPTLVQLLTLFFTSLQKFHEYRFFMLNLYREEHVFHLWEEKVDHFGNKWFLPYQMKGWSYILVFRIEVLSV